MLLCQHVPALSKQMSTNTMTDSDELLAISIPMLDNPKPADLRSI